MQSSSLETYLYLQLRGKTCDNSQWRDDQNRVVLYSNGINGFLYPKMVLCLSPSTEPSNLKSEIFDFFPRLGITITHLPTVIFIEILSCTTILTLTRIRQFQTKSS
ncbi:CUB domain-containing protein [Caerostris extrusa]|uniref:CUB domain-containing protein n=1 Tax=Caerostris extrusa TaxID=172846 RepID=A0AAV4UCW8_CAEEX|nr:CUB domain-containing protein [Caerostris extrusa]